MILLACVHEGRPAELHDVRHSYATAARSAKIDWKTLSKRIGHALADYLIGHDLRTRSRNHGLR